MSNHNIYGLDFGAGNLSSLGLPTATGGGDGGGILQMLRGLPGGLPGLGFSLGGKLLSFLGGIGGNNRKKDIYKQLGSLANIAKSGMGKDVFNVEDVNAQTLAGAEPTLQRKGREYDKRFSFDSGASAGAFKGSLIEFLGNLRPELMVKNAVGKSERDRFLLALAGNLTQAQGQYA
jgi:hypothetical protein